MIKRIKLQLVILVYSILFFATYVFAEDDLSLSSKVIPLQLENFPERPSPILELGDPLLKTGPINQGILLPTGAVIQPSLIIWGDVRSAIQTVDGNVEQSGNRLTEWANRVDLFGNLSFTPTERILIGFRPLDQDGRFTNYTFEAPDKSGNKEHRFRDEANFDFTTLFFEGDFGEIFPILDPKDQFGLDYGFSVGRQQLSLQDGILLNDRIDSVGISKINLKHDWAVNHRATLLWGWNELNRNVLSDDDSKSGLFGLSNEIDFKETTAEFDVLYVDGGETTGDGVYSGVGFTQRVYDLNNTFRVLSSHAVGDYDTVHNSDGTLIFTELSRDLEASHDYVYLNGFCGIDQFRSASRAPEFGGPLGGTGVLFAALGLGRYGAALNNQPDDACGSALGYQTFFNQKRRHILIELGGRYAFESIGQRATALGVSFQTAIGQRNVLRFDTYGRFGKERIMLSVDEDEAFSLGARVEWMIRL